MRIVFLILLLALSSWASSYQPPHQTLVIRSSATSQFFREFPLPTPDAGPWSITVTRNRLVWFVEQSAGSLGKFDPSTNTITEIPLKSSSTYILSQNATRLINSIATDPMGNVWFSLISANAIGYLNITVQSFTYYNLTLLTRRNTNSLPWGIAIDPKGIVWFAENGASRLGRLDPTNSSVHEYPLQLPSLQQQPAFLPYEIAIDNNSQVWATSNWYLDRKDGTSLSGSILVNLVPTSGKMNVYNLSAVGVLAAVGLASDSIGHVWFGDHGGSWLGEVDTITGDVTLHHTSLPPLVANPQNLTDRVYGPAASFSLVNDVVLSPDGTPWFTEHLGGRIGHYLQSTGQTIEYDIPTLRPAVLWLAADRNGGIWFTESSGNKIGYLDTLAADPPFEVKTSILTTLVSRGTPVFLTLTVTSDSTQTQTITAGVENTFWFTGPIASMTLQAGESRAISVELDTGPTTPLGNYTSPLLVSLTPMIKVSDGSINYPITVYVVVYDSSIFTQPIWVYAGLLGVAVAVTGTSIAVWNGRRKGSHQ